MHKISIPCHIKNDDHSEEAAQKRATHAADMAALNPKGFRQPSPDKPWSWGNTSIAEIRAAQAGMMDVPYPERSPRGHRKVSCRKHSNDAIREDRIKKWNDYLDHPKGCNLSGIPLTALRQHIERYVRQGYKIRMSAKNE